MKASSAVRGLLRSPTVDKRPYPDPFSPSERAVIERALLEGVDALLRSGNLEFGTCGEVAITDELELLLNRMLESDPPVVPGFTRALFQTVVRGGEMRNHDGSKAEKRPDLTFRSERTYSQLAFPQHCALFVECKIVDKNHPMHLYCGEGLRRFVNGTYAWCVPTGMMFGYARDGYEPSVQLRAHLEKLGGTYALVGKMRQRAAGSNPPRFYVTVHERDIKGMPRGPKGRITIHHVWVKIA